MLTLKGFSLIHLTKDHVVGVLLVAQMGFPSAGFVLASDFGMLSTHTIPKPLEPCAEACLSLTGFASLSFFQLFLEALPLRALFLDQLLPLLFLCLS
ncbi:hypothetical protein SAMN04488011_101840 [Palleronia pelagia]|uniref:Uncharacterized protein n=1 Tax=Palleronia pelagia TaxID=387096 RepID=A0A1H8C4C2_9RHOB|nr:hypothetical protein SAMN04488011_101840 [Palleronia pelagia]